MLDSNIEKEMSIKQYNGIKNDRYSPKAEESSFSSNLKIDKYMKKNSININKENKDTTNISFNPIENSITNYTNQNEEIPFSSNIDKIEGNNSRMGPLFSENSFDWDLIKSQRNSANPNDKKKKLKNYGSDREIKDSYFKDNQKDSFKDNNINNNNINNDSNLVENDLVKVIQDNEDENIENNKINNNVCNKNLGYLNFDILEVNEDEEEDKKTNINERVTLHSKNSQNEKNPFNTFNCNNMTYNDNECFFNKINEEDYSFEEDNKIKNKSLKYEKKNNESFKDYQKSRDESLKDYKTYREIKLNYSKSYKEKDNISIKDKSKIEKKKVNFNFAFKLKESSYDNSTIKKDPNEILKETINLINKINKKNIKITDKDIGNNYYLYETYPKISKDNEEKKFYFERNINKFIDEEDPYYFIQRRNSFLRNKYCENKLSINSSISYKTYKNYSRKTSNNLTNSLNIMINEISNRKYTFKKSNKIKIGEMEDITSLIYKLGIKNLKDNNLLKLLSNIVSFRQIENDGFSFYRAFIFSLFENYINYNKSEDIIFLTNDIIKTIPDVKNYDKIINVIREFKKNYNIEIIENAFNDSELFFDEAILFYLQKCVVEIKNNDINKYYEINYEFIKTVCDLFEVNVKIFYLIGNEYSFKFNDLVIKCNNSKKATTTLNFALFYNSFYLVYSNQDIDTSLINNNLIKETYIVNNLEETECKKCKKTTSSFILITNYNVLFCYKCLSSYLNTILINRSIMFAKNNFINLEYYTRSINIYEEIDITPSIYLSIYNNSIFEEIHSIILKICFNCFNISETIIKLECYCQFCQNCLEEFIDKASDNYKILNDYEKNTKAKINCLCKDNFNLDEALKYSKKIQKEDYIEAKKRLNNYINSKCCICVKDIGKYDNIKLKLENNEYHLICIDCYNDINKSYNSNFINGENLDSFSYGNSNKIDCKICFKEHSIIDEGEKNKKYIRKHKNNVCSGYCTNSKCFIY
jgi:hypothetical protein